MTMATKTKTETKICRSFKQDFPQFVERAQALGVHIALGEGRRNGRERVFWLDSYKQLTGYTINKDGRPFTLEDAARNIDKVLTSIEEDRQAVAVMSVDERFARVMAELRQIVPQYRMIGEVRMPCGDRAHVFFMSEYDGGVTLEGIGDVAKAKAEWRHGETNAAQLARFCDALEADFKARADA
jgi:hypothetical protein